MYIANYITLTTFLRLFMSMEIHMRSIIVPVLSSIFSRHLREKGSRGTVAVSSSVKQPAIARFPAPIGEHFTLFSYVVKSSAPSTFVILISTTT